MVKDTRSKRISKGTRQKPTRYKTIIIRVEKSSDMEEQEKKESDTSTSYRRDVGKDGNCLFRCLSIAIYENESNQARVRKEITNYMEGNQDQFAPYIDKPIHKHLQDMKKTKGGREIWGAETEIHAASMLYKRHRTCKKDDWTRRNKISLRVQRTE